jgi:hypothetical protein
MLEKAGLFTDDPKPLPSGNSGGPYPDYVDDVDDERPVYRTGLARMSRAEGMLHALKCS